MRAEVIGLAASFEVVTELAPDGTWKAPASVTLTLRPCWRKPAVQLQVALAYTKGAVAYYVEERRP